MKGILYYEVLALGFVRINEHDIIYFKQMGFDYFRVEKCLKPSLYIDWDPEDHTVNLVEWKPSDGTIIKKIQLFTIQEIIDIIKKYKPKDKFVKKYEEKIKNTKWVTYVPTRGDYQYLYSAC